MNEAPLESSLQDPSLQDPSEEQSPEQELQSLRVENADLRRHVQVAEDAIAELRLEALDRRQQVRALVADLPVAMSRKTLLRQVAVDAIRHPDKAGVAARVVNKMRRTIRNAIRR